MGANEKVEATFGDNFPGVEEQIKMFGKEREPTPPGEEMVPISQQQQAVSAAVAALHVAEGELSATAIMERADEIVAAFQDRIQRQVEIINRLLHEDSDGAQELERAQQMIDNLTVKMIYLEKQLLKAQKRAKK